MNTMDYTLLITQPVFSCALVTGASLFTLQLHASVITQGHRAGGSQSRSRFHKATGAKYLISMDFLQYGYLFLVLK